MRKKGIFLVGFFVGCMLCSGVHAQDNEKLAQTGFQFLSVVSDAQAASMAEAMTSLQIGSRALFFNPAGMAVMSGMFDVSVSTNQWIADISHNTFSAAINPANGRYGVFGVSVQSVDYGEFYLTRVNKGNLSGYDDIGTITLNAIAIGGGYAKQLTDRFSVGGQIRWAKQNLGESVVPVVTASDTSKKTVNSELTPMVFDFGTQFRTGFQSLVFGMSVRNFSKEIKYVEEGFQVPLVFNLGISMNLLDLFESISAAHCLIMSLDASHFRDHPEQVKIGLDYSLMNTLSLRGGYMSSNDENGLTFGMGVARSGVSLDYAYTPFGVFDKVQRLTARFAL